MTEDRALEIAIRAEAAAQSAHHRLDRMNGSIDRLSGEVKKANDKSEEILRILAGQDGARRYRRSLWVAIGVFAGSVWWLPELVHRLTAVH